MRHRCVVVGISGRVGVGKSEAAAIVQRHFDCRVVDLDALGHQVLREPRILAAVAAEFGKDILDGSGEIDRSKLGAKVFSDPVSLQRLNGFVHPEIYRLTAAAIQSAEKPVIVVGALIDEIGVRALCDAVVVIDAENADIRAKVGGKFDRIAPLQRSRDEYVRTADFTVSNTFDACFELEMLRLFRRLL